MIKKKSLKFTLSNRDFNLKKMIIISWRNEQSFLGSSTNTNQPSGLYENYERNFACHCNQEHGVIYVTNDLENINDIIPQVDFKRESHISAF
jgi:hypothetical protein